MTVIGDTSDTYMRHRFTGHFNIKENYYGMRTLIYESFVNDELLCLLGLVGQEVECPVPDIILLNGGHHDVHSGTGQCDNVCLDIFANALRKFFDFLNANYQKAGINYVKLFWKGTLLTPRDIAYGLKNNRGALFLLDKAAQQVTHEYGIPYINASDVLQYIPRFQELNRMYEIYTKDRIHHGPIARSHDANKVGTVSMLVTQKVLGAMCPEVINADPTLGMGSRAAPMIDTSKLAGNVPGMLGSLPAPKYDMNHGFGDQRQAGNMMMNNGGNAVTGSNNLNGMIGTVMNNNGNEGGMMSRNGGGSNTIMTNNMMGNRFNTMMNTGNGGSPMGMVNSGNGMSNNVGTSGTSSGAKDFGSQRLELVREANARIASNQDALKEDLSGGNLEDKSGESRFAAIERQRCASGRCKKGYIEGTADDPKVNGRASDGNMGDQASIGNVVFTNSQRPTGSDSNRMSDYSRGGTTNSMDDRSSQNTMDMALGPGVSLTPRSSTTTTTTTTSSSPLSSSGNSGDSSTREDDIPEWKKKQLAARNAFRAQNGLDAAKIESKRKKKLDTTSTLTNGGIGLRRNRRRLRENEKERST